MSNDKLFYVAEFVVLGIFFYMMMDLLDDVEHLLDVVRNREKHVNLLAEADNLLDAVRNQEKHQFRVLVVGKELKLSKENLS